MAKALDHAIAFLEEPGLPYHRREGILVTEFTHDNFRHQVWIRESSEGQLMTLMEEVCRSQDRRERLSEIVNQLNGLGAGKYIARDDGRVEFYLDHLWTDEPCPSAFKKVFDAVLSLVEGRHSIVMRMAWGGISLHQALKYEGKSKKRRSKLDRQLDAILRNSLKYRDPEGGQTENRDETGS